jgi:hypothetical protein
MTIPAIYCPHCRGEGSMPYQELRPTCLHTAALVLGRSILSKL